ncbi:MAG: tetratricopeptide repeat protein, partial [Roseiflexaceae bacterium]|nr:tetratricopeptide repeat protein [Roseiflexaceae bacterium]
MGALIVALMGIGVLRVLWDILIRLRNDDGQFNSSIQNPLGPGFISGVTLAFLILLWYLEARQRSKASRPIIVPSVSDPPWLAALTGDLDDFRQCEGFIDAVRREEIRTLITDLSQAPRYTWRARLVWLMTFGLAWRRRAPEGRRLAIITGIGGIGKTSLAKRIGYDHRIRSWYPDGQYYINFGGFDNRRQNELIGEAFERLLTEKSPDFYEWVRQVRQQATARKGHLAEINAYVDELLRRLHGRRVLLIFDDPPEHANLERMIPPSGCAAIFVARPGHAGMRRAFSRYRWLHLQPMTEANALMVMRHHWTTAFDETLAREFARLCSYVPLALVVVGRTAQAESASHGVEGARCLLEKLRHNQQKSLDGRRRALKRLLPSGNDWPDRQRLEQIARLSYNLLSVGAQRMFRRLAIMENRPFSRTMAVEVCGAGVSQDDAVFEEIVQQGLLTVLDSSDDSAKLYGFFEVVFSVARNELETHQFEIPGLQARYVVWAANYATRRADRLLADLDEAGRILFDMKRNMAHLQAALHMLKNRHIALDHQTRDHLLLTLAAAGYELLRAGHDRFADDQQSEREAAVFAAARADRWRATAEEAFHCVYAALPADLQMSVARLAVFGGTLFEPDDARVITETSEAHLMQLLNTGLLRRCGDVIHPRCNWAQQSRRRTELLDRLHSFVPSRRRRALRGRRWTSQTRRFNSSIRPRRRWVLPGRRWTGRVRGFSDAVRPRLRRRLVLRGRRWRGRPERFDSAVRLRRRWVLRGRRWRVQIRGFDGAIRPRLWGQRSRRRTSRIQGFDGAFRLSWSVVQELAQRAYQQLDDTERAQCEQRYAAHFARRLAEEPFSDAIARHIERGQGYAARYAMHRQVITYADRCARHFWGRQEYERLTDWLAQAIQSAEALGDDASAAAACERLGNVCLERSWQVQSEQRTMWYEQAETHYRRALTAYPGAAPETRAQAEFGLGTVAWQRGDLDAAETHYRRVLKDHPRAAPDTQASAELGLGDTAFERDDLEAAQQHYRRVLEVHPGAAPETQAEAELGLGKVAFEHGNLEAAQQHFRRVLNKHPNANPDTRASAELRLGDIAKRWGQWDAAEAHYRQVLAAHPGAALETRATAELGLGNIAEQRGQWDVAEEHYRRVLNDPGIEADVRAQAELGLEMVARRRQQWDIAEAHYRQELKGHPDATPGARAHIECNLGISAERQGNLDIAEAHYRRVLAAHPGATPETRATAEYGLGFVARQRGDLNAAETHYRRVLAAHPGATPETRASAELGLGNIASQRGQWEEAESHYR